MSPNSVSEGILGLVFAAFLIFLSATSSISAEIDDLVFTYLKFIYLPFFHALASGLMINSADFPPFFTRPGYITYWFLIGSFTSVVITLMFFKFVRKFPCHSTLYMQTTSDHNVFNSYSKEGNKIFREILEDIQNQRRNY